MSNVTAKPGQMASFKCQVDMSCIVAYIEWYHEMDNGTEKLIKVGILFRLSLLETVIGMSSWNIYVLIIRGHLLKEFDRSCIQNSN